MKKIQGGEITVGRHRFRDYMLTGLTALLPLWLTFYILWFLIQVIGNLIFPIIRPLLRSLINKRPPEELLIALRARYEISDTLRRSDAETISRREEGA